jgi:hypothetical protein
LAIPALLEVAAAADDEVAEPVAFTVPKIMNQSMRERYESAQDTDKWHIVPVGAEVRWLDQLRYNLQRGTSEQPAGTLCFCTRKTRWCLWPRVRRQLVHADHNRRLQAGTSIRRRRSSALETLADALSESSSGGWQRRSASGSAITAGGGGGIHCESSNGYQCQEFDVADHFVKVRSS